MTAPIPEFTEQVWNDGPTGNTEISAARGPRYWERQIAALTAAVVEQREQIAALGGATGTGVVLRVGPTDDRGPGGPGQLYIDETLGEQLLVGRRAGGWQDAMGVDLSTGGSVAAPVLTGSVGGDGSTSLSWTAPPTGSGWRYTVKERYASPNGVTGLILVTATSTTRPPSSSATQREYYVVATDPGGVETAESNHVVLYYNGYTPGSGGGATPGGGGTTPAGTPADLIAFGGQAGFWNLGVGYRPVDGGEHTDIPFSQLRAGWSRPGYYYVSDDGLWVVFESYAEGGRTSANTSYCRTELRALKSDGIGKETFNAASGLHRFGYRLKLLKLPTLASGAAGSKQEVVIGQFHNAADDTMQLRIEGTVMRLSVRGTELATPLATGVAIGSEFDVEHLISGGKLSTKINGVTKASDVTFAGPGEYAKLGMYVQFSTAADKGGYPASASARVGIRNVVYTHS